MSNKKELLKNSNLAERLKKAKQDLAGTLNEAQEEKTQPQKEETSHKSNTQKKNSIAVNPKLYVAGRFNRKGNNYTSKSFYIHKDLDSQIKAYCRGTDITVYNYLISYGLEAIKNLPEMKTVDASEVELKYSENIDN